MIDQRPTIGPPTTSTRTALLAHHLSRCIFKEGDCVTFKKPKRNKVHGIITHIEVDPNLVTWKSGSMVPFYITVEINGTTTKAKTYESKLVYDGRAK